MKRKFLLLILIMTVALSGGLVHGQGSLEAGPKKPRTPADYQRTTLKEILIEDANRDGLLPFRVRATYTASVRPISTTSSEALHDWAQCCAGNPDHYKGYVRELRFIENGAAYWLAAEDRLVADFRKEAKVGDAVDLFLIRLSAPETKGKRGSVLLVERFQRAATDDDQRKESVDWIRDNLPSYAEKTLTVEVPGPCQLKITDSSNASGVSKAVVFLPLTDLDPVKISVLKGQLVPSWHLWLHTISGKRSIRFMLYQGSPAEGGEADKYSLIFLDRKKADAMAAGFRRAVDICAGATSSPLN